jgi:hypothetical protein
MNGQMRNNTRHGFDARGRKTQEREYRRDLIARQAHYDNYIREQELSYSDHERQLNQDVKRHLSEVN